MCTGPDGVDPEMTSGEKWKVFGNLDRPGMSESGLGVNTGIGYDARLTTARTASAAWKASAKHWYKMYFTAGSKQRQRAEAAEKKVAELEKWIVQELDRRAKLLALLAEASEYVPDKLDEKIANTI